ncbi:MAG: exo-beta-N-acetylmuramidase NamZ domain-containing protein [Thermodesulfobacteriota bacterium]
MISRIQPPGLSARLFVIVMVLIILGLAGCAAYVPPPLPPVIVEPPPAPAPPEAPPPAISEIDSPRFARISQVAQREIAAGHVPGAVILVGHQGRIVYRKAFGLRAVEPVPQPMTVDTIFDLASLTKVVATTMAIMKLADQGCLKLDAPVATYWPAFAANGKGSITIRQLMTHSSGLRAGLMARFRWSDYDGAMAAVIQDCPVNSPGKNFCYSDVNFITLGEIVHRVSGLPLDAYCAKEVFKPLGMRDTSFNPSPALKNRIAPTDYQGHGLRWGQVSDPTTYRMGGVAGHAGVFSTANDLAILAQMIIDGGTYRGKRFLDEKTVMAMEKPQRIHGSFILRNLGWDVQSPYSKIFNTSFPTGSFGHTGYTGTSIWIDPRSETFLIILTSRLHPRGKGNVKPLRVQVSEAVASALQMGPPARRAFLHYETDDTLDVGYGASDLPDRVRPGIEVLAAGGFAPLAGKTIGVITNHTGIDTAGRSTLNLLLRAPEVKVRAIFSPEHGLSGKLDEKVASGRDAATGLPVYSLYGKVNRPTPQMLRGLDALVYDIQDVGCRYYTYITTMAYAMEAAATAGLDFYVLDRPDPITASMVQGPVLDPDLKSFIGYFPLPIRYGMTAGELAQLFNCERRIGAKLKVVKMEGYRRDLWFNESGLPWVNPSPNLRSLTQAILYPGVGMVESANVSVGRGTPTPFEIMGAPWISGPKLSEYLNRRGIGGVVFEPVVFTPAAAPYRQQRCEGIRLRVADRAVLDSPALGVELTAALYRLYPQKFQFGGTLGMVGSREVIQAIRYGVDPRDIHRQWLSRLDNFLRLRAKYLLY